MKCLMITSAMLIGRNRLLVTIFVLLLQTIMIFGDDGRNVELNNGHANTNNDITGGVSETIGKCFDCRKSNFRFENYFLF